jgi:rod shape-determining protein MreC
VISLWDTIRDWVVLLSLLALSTFVMVTENSSLSRSMRAGALRITAPIEQRFSGLATFMTALDENASIRAQNISLSSQVARLRGAALENQRLRALLSLRDSVVFRVLPVEIVSKDIHRQKNILIIDAGSEDGLEPDMAVIDDRGILGKVVLVSKNYAQVQSYLNTDFRVPVEIQPLQASGIVRWDGARTDRIRLDYVVKTEPVEKGQLVVTRGSTVFPSGIAVGTVDTVLTRPGENLVDIFLVPASPIRTARHAFVVLQKPDPELLDLIVEAN